MKEGLATGIQTDSGDTMITTHVGTKVNQVTLGVIRVTLGTDGKLARTGKQGVCKRGATVRTRASIGGAIMVYKGWEQGGGVVMAGEGGHDTGKGLCSVEGEDVVAVGWGVEGKVGDLCDVVVKVLGYEETGAVLVVAGYASDVDVTGYDVGGGGDFFADGESDGNVGGAKGGDY